MRRYVLTITFLLSATAANAQSLARVVGSVGGVVRDVDNRPVPFANIVTTDSTLGTVADDTGWFKIDGLHAGTDTLTIRRVGYEPLTFAVGVVAASTVWLAVKMVPLLPVLETVKVAESAADADPGLARTGFLKRMKSAPGHFITPGDVATRNPSTLGDIMQSQPFLTVSRSGALVSRRITSMRGGGCALNVFIDGIRTSARNGYPIVGGDIKAVEYYESQSKTPAEFQSIGAGGGCGTVLVWTKAN